MARVMTWLLLALMIVAAGCDEAADADAGLDGALMDGALMDGGLEAGPDRAVDAMPDASDVMLDAIPDASDAIADASDAIPDAMPDASDAMPDAIPDRGPLDLGPPPAPLIVLLDAPADGARVGVTPIAVSGRVGLPVDGLDVAGIPVEADAAGRFALDVPLVEGANPIVARATRGDAAAEARISVTLDTRPPALSIDQPLADALIAADRVTVEGAADDAVRVTVSGAPASIDGGRYAVVVALAEGPNLLEAVALDAVGNAARLAVAVQRDLTPPTVRIDAPADGAALAAEAVEVRGTVDDPAAEATLNGEPLALIEGRFAVEHPLVEGPNRLTVAALDGAGNRGAATVIITRDTTAPALTVDHPLDGALVAAETIRFAGSIDDRAATLTVGGQPTPISPAGLWASVVPLVEGANPVAVAAVDGLGNRRALTVRVDRDTLPPALVVESPAEGAVIAAESVELRGTTDPDARLTVGGAAVAIGPDGGFAVELPVVRGVNAAVLVATDPAGNIRRVERRFVGDRDGPGLQVDAPAPGTLTADDGVDVRGAVLDPDAVVRVNGAPAAVVDGRFEARVALAEGENTVVVEASDPAGNSERVDIPVVRDSTPPALTIDAPADGAALRAAAVEVRGAVEVAAALTLALNGAAQAVAIADGGFSAAVELSPGRNTVVAEAVDAAGNRSRVEIALVLDDQPPGLWIDSPADDAVLAEGSVRVAGRVGDPAAAVSVGGLAAEVDGAGRFVADVPLEPGANLIAAVSARRATAITVHRDTAAPRLTLLGAAASGAHDRSQVDVLGRVVDRALDGPVAVRLGERQAQVSADGFVLRDVPLQIGRTSLTLVAEDAAGNRAPTTVEIEHRPRAGQRLLRVGGLHQRGVVGEPLAEPLVVAARDAYGAPLAGAKLAFAVIAGDGVLDAFPARGRTVTAITDAAGLARVGFTLGGRAGFGAQRVRVRGADDGPALGRVDFAPDAVAGPAARVVVAGGQRQIVTAGDDLRFTLRITDAFGNPAPGAAAAIEGLQGVDFAADSLAGPDGRLRLRVPTIAPGAVVLRASIDGARTPLLATAEAAGDGPTRLSGRLIDTADGPLAGLTVFAALADGPALSTRSDAAGRFALDVPPGAVVFGIDAPDRFTERRAVLVRPGSTADLGPITLPALDPMVGAGPFVLPTLAGAALAVTCADCVERGGVVRASSWPPADGAVPAATTAWLGDGLDDAGLCLPALDIDAGGVRDVLARRDGRWIRLGTATAIDDPAAGLRLCTDRGMGLVGAAVYGLATRAPAPSCPADCDDGDPCTVGRCEDGRCVFEPVDGTPCGDDCRAATCAGGVCAVEAITPDGTRCDDGDACSTDTVCLEGVCSGSAVDCPEAPCTVSACDPGVGCLQLPAPDGSSCADAPCVADICRGGLCVERARACPAPDDPCQAAACDPETGACAAAPVADGTPCGDAACGAPSCQGGACTPAVDPPEACDDGDRCTVDDLCAAGRCVGRGPPDDAAPFAPEPALFDRPLAALTDRMALLLARHPPFVAPFGEPLRFDVAGTRRACCADGEVQPGGGLEASAGWRRFARLDGALDGLTRQVQIAGPGARVTVALTVDAALDLTLAGSVAVQRDACAETGCTTVDGRLAASGSLVASAAVVGCVAEAPGACAGLLARAGPLRLAISGQCALQLGLCTDVAPPACTVTVGPLPVAVTLSGPAGRTTTPVSLYRP